MSSFPDARYKFRESGPDWQFWWEGQENNKFQNPLLSVGPSGQPFQDGTIYRIYSQVDGGDAELSEFYFNALGVPQAASAGSAPPGVATTTAPTSTTPETLDTVSGRGNITSRDIRLGSLTLERVPDNINFEHIFVPAPDSSFYGVAKAGIAFFINRIYTPFINKMISEGRFDGIGGAGSAVLQMTQYNWDVLRESIFRDWANKTNTAIDGGAVPGVPAPPVFQGGTSPTNPTPALIPVVNTNQSEYHSTVGIIIIGNCSNGDIFYGRARGVGGVVVIDQEWKLLSRPAENGGNAQQGTYLLYYQELSTPEVKKQFVSGAGTLILEMRAGVDNSTIKAVSIPIIDKGPQPLPQFEIDGPDKASLLATTFYKLYQLYTQGPRQLYTGSDKRAVLEVAPLGTGIDNSGNLSTGETAGPARIRFDVSGIQTIKAITVGDVNSPIDYKIRFGSARYEDPEFVSTVNVWSLAEVQFTFYQSPNGVKTEFHRIPWTNMGQPTDGTIASGQATLAKRINKNQGPSAFGTYSVEAVVRPAGVTGDTIGENRYLYLAAFNYTNGDSGGGGGGSSAYRIDGRFHVGGETQAATYGLIYHLIKASILNLQNGEKPQVGTATATGGNGQGTITWFDMSTKIEGAFNYAQGHWIAPYKDTAPGTADDIDTIYYYIRWNTAMTPILLHTRNAKSTVDTGFIQLYDGAGTTTSWQYS